VGYGYEMNSGPISGKGWGFLFYLDDECWERFEKKEKRR
jgi:hypothetical protein